MTSDPGPATGGDAELPTEAAVQLRGLRSALDRVHGEAVELRAERDAARARVGELEAERERLTNELRTARRRTKRLRGRVRDVERRHDRLAGRRVVRALLAIDRLRGRLGARMRRTRPDAAGEEPGGAAAPTGRPATKALPLVRLTALRPAADHAFAPVDDLRAALDRGERLRLAAVVSAQTWRDLEPECTLVDASSPDAPTPTAPHLLFVEADDRSLAGLGRLAPLLDRWSGRIPTVLWCTADLAGADGPALDVAARFDRVYSVDPDVLPRDAALLGHDRVGFLPFACQPRHDHPVETGPRRVAVRYTGGYDAGAPDQMGALRALLDGAAEVVPVEVLDPWIGTTDPARAFPPELAGLVTGTVAAGDRALAHKQARYAIALHPPTSSQGLVGRDLFTLLATGTSTLTSYARGGRTLFGDLVPMTGSRSAARGVVEHWEDDPDRRERLRVAALRKVLAEHTWAHRLGQVAADLTGTSASAPPPAVLALVPVTDLASCHRALQALAGQVGVEARPLFLDGEGEARDWLAERGHAVGTTQGRTVADVLPPDVVGAAVVHPDDWYGPHHLLDLVQATRYSTAAVIGKAPAPGSEYRAGVPVHLRAALVTAAGAAAVRLADVVGDAVAPAALDRLAIHRFDHRRGGAGLAATELAAHTSDADVDHGARLTDIQALLSAAPPPRPDPLVPDPAAFPETVRPRLAVRHHRGRLEIDSGLRPGAAASIRADGVLDVRQVWPDGVARLRLLVTGAGRVDVGLRLLDGAGAPLRTLTLRSGVQHEEPLPDGATTATLGLTVRGPGRTTVHALAVAPWCLEPAAALDHRDVLVVSEYPTYDDRYRLGFVHARVRRYLAAGLRLEVFRVRRGVPTARSEYEGAEVVTGAPAVLRRLLESGRYQVVLAHFLTPTSWSVLRDYQDRLRTIIWIHGAEVQSWHRRAFNHTTAEERAAAQRESDIRTAFWQDVLDEPTGRTRHYVFVSEHLAREAAEDLGRTIDPRRSSVIHNPIDTEIFRYEPKAPEQRHRILSVRPYASRVYANDLAVAAVLELSDRPWFDELEFRFVGDGPLFEETLAPLRGLANVRIDRGFLSQPEVAALYREYGVVLIPTRSDTHGVSRDEAMASGMVPVTSAVAAVPEFVGPDEGFLAPYDDQRGLADAIATLHEEPETFLRMSAAAAQRVRRQAAADLVIPRELALIRGS
jgi:glycosyltransferase involved in cell wall biosynthesis